MDAILITLIRQIVTVLVDVPENVNVTEVEGEKITVVELRVDPTDLGKVIGRQGKTARSMRTLLGAVAKKNGKKAVLEIIE